MIMLASFSLNYQRKVKAFTQFFSSYKQGRRSVGEGMEKKEGYNKNQPLIRALRPTKEK